MKQWSRRLILKEFLIALVLLFVLSNLISYIRKPELASTHLPRIEATLLDGTTFKVEEGKPLLLYFWAVWCPVCKLQSSNIEFISQRCDVLTIAVGSGSDEEIKRYMQERGLSFKVINDKEGKWAKEFKVEVYPTTFIYDAQGKLKFTEVGYRTTAGLLTRFQWSK